MAAAEAAASRAKTRSRLFTYGGIALAVLIAVIVVVQLTSDDEPVEAEPGAQLIDDPAATPTTVPPPGVSTPAPGGSIEGETPCPADDGSEERITSFELPPQLCIDPTATYTAAVDTSYGEFTIELDAARAPNTVNNFVVLARYGYYDEAPFHRIIENFVIQGGDAVGAQLGTGNPGYAVDDELPEAGEYEIGSVAMANSGPNTNGSQFFVVTGDNGAALPPQYSLFGSVSDGLDIVMAIEGAETTIGDAPVDNIVINSVTITES